MSNLLGGEQSMLEKLMAAQERIAELDSQLKVYAGEVDGWKRAHQRIESEHNRAREDHELALCNLREAQSKLFNAEKRLKELEAENARLRVDGWFPANLANVPTGDMRRKVLSYWSSGTVEGKYTAEELAYHIAAHAKHGDHFVVAKAWAEYPTAAIDAAKESA